MQITVLFLALVLAQSSPLDDANRLYTSQQFAQAAKAYAAVVQTDPSNGQAWYRLGISLLEIDKISDAQAPLERALALHFNPAATLYALAEQQAQAGNVQTANSYLTRSYSLRPIPPRALQADDSLKSLRASDAYQTLLAQATARFEPCTVDAKYRALDFWTGDWAVHVGTTGSIAHSHVERILDGCVIFENWTDAYGNQGKSFSFYDAKAGHWVQHWVDGVAGFRDYTGGPSGSSMVFLTADGTTRMTYTPLPNGHVRQFIESSKDGGKTWKPVFDGDYERSKP